MLTILYKNARGMDNSSSQENLKTMCNKYKPDFVCLAELMVEFASISPSFWRTINCDSIVVNIRANNIANIWLLASSSVAGWTITVLEPTDQHVYVCIDHDNTSHIAAFV